MSSTDSVVTQATTPAADPVIKTQGKPIVYETFAISGGKRTPESLLELTAKITMWEGLGGSVRAIDIREREAILTIDRDVLVKINEQVKSKQDEAPNVIQFDPSIISTTKGI